MHTFTRYFTAIVAIILLLPLTSQASIQGFGYSFGEQNALFMVEFSFATAENDYYIPLRAARSDTPINDTITYHIERSNGTAAPVTTKSVVVSDEKVSEDYYHIDAGDSSDFTLVVFAEFDAPVATEEYRLVIDTLPHRVGDDRIVTPIKDTARPFLATPAISFPASLGN